MSEIKEKGHLAKMASYQLLALSSAEKNTVLQQVADQLKEDADDLISENKKDLDIGKKNGLSNSVLDRIMLNEKRLLDMVNSIHLLIQLPDPISETLERIEKDNGLHIEKKRVPLGVIGMIYEARPNVTIDAATLCIKTGNAVLLRGSSSAKYSNVAIVRSIHRALKKTGYPVEAVQLIEDTSRKAAKELFHLNEYLDVLIPRGGKNLIQTVVQESTVPVLETGAGNCHIFIDESADLDMARRIVLNGKTSRPSVCNAVETILIEKNWFTQYGKKLLDSVQEANVEIYGDKAVCKLADWAKPATEEDWFKEYLDLAVSVKVVEKLEEAIAHINHYGTKHSEAIITENTIHAARFLTEIDAAAVYHNASTRFTDGFEFGYGAEIGISTQKLHARGPMGLKALTSSKFFIYGEGQIRE
ncbi:glutamate-5-semialdehyde dehydrogenase [Bacillaceae bacterium Marseille-Q3522]|nr:glutamate-5-semialdehyde dehydrogenase [Bacillaceae bacterium Marseille-Q3522]